VGEGIQHVLFGPKLQSVFQANDDNFRYGSLSYQGIQGLINFSLSGVGSLIVEEVLTIHQVKDRVAGGAAGIAWGKVDPGIPLPPKSRDGNVSELSDTPTEGQRSLPELFGAPAIINLRDIMSVWSLAVIFHHLCAAGRDQ
jgi:hypothetical protein